MDQETNKKQLKCLSTAQEILVNEYVNRYNVKYKDWLESDSTDVAPSPHFPSQDEIINKAAELFTEMVEEENQAASAIALTGDPMLVPTKKDSSDSVAEIQAIFAAPAVAPVAEINVSGILAGPGPVASNNVRDILTNWLEKNQFKQGTQ
jgi:hypothetical protein